jgi:hypothetical protein
MWPFSPRKTRRPSHPPGRLFLEVLEDRLCLSGGYLLVASQDNNSVQRYDEGTGAFVDTFVPKGSGGLTMPGGLILGRVDHDLYVSSGVMPSNQPNHNVLRYDGGTGAFLDTFADGGQVIGPRGLLFGPDGNLYVADGTGVGTVLRFNGTTGTFIDEFVPADSGLKHPFGMVFGPDGANDGKLDLYVASITLNSVLRYDGTTGAFEGAFVLAGSGGLKGPLGLTFGPDGNLYVASSQLFDFTQGRASPGSILRFEGPNGPSPGAFLGTFVPAGSGGLNTPLTPLFGPDANGDGVPDLYVSSAVLRSQPTAQPGTSEVLRYDGVTGAFIDTFVTPDSGGVRDPVFMTFTETDPTTLNYAAPTSGPSLTSAITLAQPATGSPALAPAPGASPGVPTPSNSPSATTTWPGTQQAAASLLPQPTLTKATIDLAPLLGAANGSGSRNFVLGDPARGIPSSVISVQGDLAGVFDFANGTASYNGQTSHFGAFGGGFQVVGSGPDGALVTTGTFVAANGDTLTKSSTITLGTTGTPGIDTFTDVVIITGGTGRFAGVVGLLTITGQADLSTGAFSGEITGTLSRPEK